MIIPLLLGTLIGLVAGFLPGLGTASALLLLMPFVVLFEPFDIFLIYLAMVISTQYSASVLAITIGVPGMDSAITVAKEYTNIQIQGLQDQALIQNATSSLIGNIVGSILFLIITPLLFDLPHLFQNKIKLIILFLAYLIIIYVNKSRLNAILLIVLGSFLMWLGYDEESRSINNLGFDFLNSGISWIPLLLGPTIGYNLYTIGKYTNKNIHSQTNKNTPSKNLVRNTSLRVNSLFSSIRGGVIGFFIGFIPGLSYFLSAILSYSIELKILKNSTPSKRLLGSLAASESAQGSGSIAMLIPFLVFLIPITISEGIILNIISINGNLRDIFNTIISLKYEVLFLVFCVNIICFSIVYTIKDWIKYILKINFKNMMYVIFVIGMLTTYLTSEIYHTLDIITYILTVAFFYFTKSNPIPFILAVVLYNTTIQTLDVTRLLW